MQLLVVLVVFLTPQPQGNCTPGLAFDLQCLVLAAGWVWGFLLLCKITTLHKMLRDGKGFAISYCIRKTLWIAPFYPLPHPGAGSASWRSDTRGRDRYFLSPHPDSACQTSDWAQTPPGKCWSSGRDMMRTKAGLGSSPRPTLLQSPKSCPATKQLWHRASLTPSLSLGFFICRMGASIAQWSQCVYALFKWSRW